jgi:hypothetical protein
VSSTLRKPPGALATMYKFRTFRDSSGRPDVETTNPGSSRARREGCTCSPVANNYGAGPDFTTDPACPLHVALRLPPIEPGQLRCQVCAGGTPDRARFCSAECRRAGRDRRYLTPAFRERQGDIMRSKLRSPETRAKIAASRRGVPLTEEHRLKISLSQRRRLHSTETRERIASSMRGRRRSESWKLPERTCPCGVAYTPTSPNQKWHAVDCPARRSPTPPAQSSEAA